MCPLQSKPGSISIGEAFIKDRDVRNDDKASPKILIKQANAINILLVFKNYNIRIDDYNKRCQCPFFFHKNGSENSGSFFYYKDTNSFYCFGCKHGGGATDFVSLYDNISKIEAAIRLLKKFDIDPSFDVAEASVKFITRQQLFLDFSELIRNFIFDNLDDNHAFAYTEKVSLIFDTINSKHNLDNNGLKSLIEKLKIKLDQYKCQ
jgi:hypothetical protein